MADVSTFDSRLRVEAISRDGMTFRDVKDAPFSVHGVFYEEDRFRRIPLAVAEQVSDGVRFLNDNTAGGRVRFRTDSAVVAVYADLCAVGKMPHRLDVSGVRGEREKLDRLLLVLGRAPACEQRAAKLVHRRRIRVDCNALHPHLDRLLARFLVVRG